MIRVRACSVSLSRHACMFLSFFLSIFSPLSLSLFSHLKSFWQREVIVEESSKILCGWLTATSMPLSPSLSFFHPPSLLLFSHSFSLSLYLCGFFQTCPHLPSPSWATLFYCAPVTIPNVQPFWPPKHGSSKDLSAVAWNACVRHRRRYETSNL